MAIFGQKLQKGETGKYFATFKEEEIAQRTANMFKTIDGGIHTINGCMDNDLVSQNHDYSGQKNSLLGMQWENELAMQKRADAEAAKKMQEVAEYQALRAKTGGIPLSMDSAREASNASSRENLNTLYQESGALEGNKSAREIDKATSEYLQNKEESVDDVLNDGLDEVYKNNAPNTNVSLETPSRDVGIDSIDLS